MAEWSLRNHATFPAKITQHHPHDFTLYRLLRGIQRVVDHCCVDQRVGLTAPAWLLPVADRLAGSLRRLSSRAHDRIAQIVVDVAAAVGKIAARRFQCQYAM